MLNNFFTIILSFMRLCGKIL